MSSPALTDRISQRMLHPEAIMAATARQHRRGISTSGCSDCCPNDRPLCYVKRESNNRQENYVQNCSKFAG